MATVVKDLFIEAPPERVFDIIAGVEGFSRYSSFIDSVVRIAPNTYEWKIDLIGMTLSWRAEVVESSRPVRFAWQSISGVCNSGSYVLSPEGSGTRVLFTLEYHLAGSALEALLAPAIGRIMTVLSDELLKNIKKALESSDSRA